MSDFANTWRLIRGRFDETVGGLSPEQLNWQLHPGALTIGQMAVHVAGVEVSFVSQLVGSVLDGAATRLKSAATDGVVNDNPFPFANSELSGEKVAEALEFGRGLVERLIADDGPALRQKQIVSALGPVIDGDGALARLAYHPGYHQGQAYLIKTAPGFPS